MKYSRNLSRAESLGELQNRHGHEDPEPEAIPAEDSRLS